jgi:Sigma-70 factor, region 1.1
MTVLSDELLNSDDLKQLIEEAEQAGSVGLAEVTDLIEAHGLDPIAVDALYRELEQRGIDVLDAHRSLPRSRSRSRTRRRRTLFSCSCVRRVAIRC